MCSPFFFIYSLSPQGATHAAPSVDGKLVRTTRVRRQTLGRDQPAPSTNMTLSDQSVVFNHVYNINVPAESLCSVDLEASDPPDGDHFVFVTICIRVM